MSVHRLGTDDGALLASDVSANSVHSGLPSGALKVAYLINQYPKVSHSFIRREILALEAMGIKIVRFALRGWDADVADDADAAERQSTRYVLQDRLGLVLDGLRFFLHRPGAWWRGLRLTLKLGWRAERPLLLHLVYLLEACRLCRWLEDAGVNHLHVHFGTNPAVIATLVRRLGGPPFSFTVHGPEEFDAPRAWKLADTVAASSFVVVISSYGRSQLYRWTSPAEWHKVRVVHCGLDETFMQPPMQNAEPGVRPARLICVGRLTPQKGQALLLKAMRRVFDLGHAFDLVLAGDGELREALEQQIIAAGLQANVRITGWISGQEVRDQLLASRALVLPSFAEGLPVVLMEALALQRPAITTYVAGIPELVRHGQSGWLVPAGDVEALAQAMVECLESSAAALASMGASGRTAVVQAHDVAVEAAKLAELFQMAARVGHNSDAPA